MSLVFVVWPSLVGPLHSFGLLTFLKQRKVVPHLCSCDETYPDAYLCTSINIWHWSTVLILVGTVGNMRRKLVRCGRSCTILYVRWHLHLVGVLICLIVAASRMTAITWSRVAAGACCSFKWERTADITESTACPKHIPRRSVSLP